MCFDLDARPPVLPEPMAGGAADGWSLILESSDGNRFAAYAARASARPANEPGHAEPPVPPQPSIPPGTGIVVLPDIRGLVPFYEELVLRFAEAGVHALAIDLYARTAGSGERGPDFDQRGHAERTTQRGIALDVAAAVAYLRSEAMEAQGALFTVGFCFGGRRSLLQAVEHHGLAGVISFYGFPTGRAPNAEAPADVAERFRCPVLALYGGADTAIPPQAIQEFDRALERAGLEHESVVYPGAPHSFFDRKQDQFADASRDAWTRALSFMARHGSAGQ